MGLDYSDRKEIINKLQQAVVGAPVPPKEETGFTYTIDRDTGTVYCNMLGHTYTMETVREALKYFSKQSARHKEEKENKVKAAYEDIAALCIQNVLERKESK